MPSSALAELLSEPRDDVFDQSRLEPRVIAVPGTFDHHVINIRLAFTQCRDHLRTLHRGDEIVRAAMHQQHRRLVP